MKYLSAAFAALFVCATLLINPLLIGSALAQTVNAETARVLDISVQSIDGRIAAAVTFSSKVQGSVDLDKWLNIETLEGEQIDGSWILDEKAKILYFTNIEPERSYLVSVEPGLPLGDLKFLKTGSSAQVDVQAISPMLGFAGNGNLLAGTLSDGLPVIAVNVPQVDVDFYRIPESQLVAFLSENSRRGQLDFWQVRDYVDSFELAYTARFDLQLARNQTATSYLPIKNIVPLQRQGVYLAVMRKSGQYRYSYPSTWFAVSDLGVHMRIYADRADVTVSSLASAEPIEKVQLTLLDANGKQIARRSSNATGFTSFSASQLDKAQLLMAIKGQQTSIVRLFGPVLDLSEFPVSGIVDSPRQLFFYAERDLYRPGEALTVSALLRDSDGKLLPPQVLTFKLKRPDGRIASEQRLSANVLGYYASHWQLPKDAPTGAWSVTAQLAGQAASSYALQVEEFLPERMELLLETPEFVATDAPFQVSVTGKYLYGAPASSNILQSELVTKLAAHPFKDFSEYHFSNPQIADFNRRISLDDSHLDKLGELKIAPKSFWGKAKTPLRLKLYASLLDSGGRPVSRIANSFALPAEQLLGIRPMFADDSAPYDSNASFELLLTDGKTKLAADNLQVKLIREQRNYHWLYTEGEGWTSDYTERHYSVSNTQLSISEGQIATVSLPVDWGHYRLEVTNPATKIVTGYKFRAGWSADETVLAGRPDRIGLALNKQRYRVGDLVEVEIKPPAAGRGYLLVESDQALHRQLIDVPAEGAKVSFKVQPGWDTHNLYVSVLLIQPGSERQQKLPRRMLGIAPLALDREERKLQLTLEAPSKIRPNTQLSVPIKISVAAGSTANKLRGPLQLTLAAVDVGVLNISRFESPDPFTGFFQQRAYGVDARDSYADLINADAGVLAQLKFGGDGDSLQGGEADPDVQIVSLFSGLVDVDARGEATVQMDIPNFNGRLRLMAVAFSADSFGSEQRDIEVAAPIVAQLSKPRFLRGGDQSQLALDLNNLSGLQQQLELQLDLGQGLSFSAASGEARQRQSLSVSLAAGEKRVLYFPVQAAMDYRSVAIDLSLANIALTDSKQTIDLARHWQLSVQPAWAITDRQWQKVLSPKQSFNLDGTELRDLIPGGLSGQLNVSSRPPLDIASHLSALKAYPYGCLEQTTSGVFPQLYVDDQLLAELGISGSEGEARSSAIELAIARLQGMQRSSGGFGLWSEQSPEEHWLSVYVLDFLLRATAAGYQVPEQNLKKLLQRVSTYLRNPGKIRSYYEEINAETKFAIRAYAGQVLARHKAAPLSILRQMYQRRSAHETPLALLQLGLALQSAGDNNRAAQAIGEALSGVDDFGSERIYYSSRVRDLALGSFWLLESDAASSNWQPLLLSLVQALEQRQWLSTQERNALFLLGKELRKTAGSEMHLVWQLAGKKMQQQLQRLQVPLTNAQLQQSIELQNLGTGNVYLNLRASGYQRSAPQPLDKGLRLQRKFYQLNGEPFNTQSIRSGDKLIVELTVSADRRLRHALIVDQLPAGMEIENQNLADSYDQSDLQLHGESISQLMEDLQINYQEYRDDRFVMALDLPGKRTQKVYYLVRAVTPGTFSIPPTFAEDMYRPEIRHQGSAAGTLMVTPR
ncbi:hypothetical protein A9R01_02745 ['Osedax' symbiont bacterium Rs2_46_30_T18]|nr:hypothetical protein A9R01_02745 ['Osedax' symbiont bacterium Rs2_46_30_T18]